jgi:outer membrane receptor for ferrienterochelin and colicins
MTPSLVLLLHAGLLFLPLPDAKEGDAPAPLALREVVVEGDGSAGIPAPQASAEGRRWQVTRAQMTARGARNLVEALSLEPAVVAESSCSICGAAALRLGGLPAEYTLVTIDGVPLLGALSSTYGVMMLEAAGLERIDIVRGARTVTHQADAIAGVIDLQTRRADRPLGDVLMEVGNQGHLRLAALAGGGQGTLQALAWGSHTRRAFQDRNGDGISEAPETTLSTVGAVVRDRVGEAQVGARVLAAHEERQGGALTGDGRLAPLDDEVRRGITETILTQRLETAAWVRAPLGLHDLDAWAGAGLHDQDSDYGGEVYLARQHNVAGQVAVQGPLAPSLEYRAGVSHRFDRLEENLATEVRRWQQGGLFADTIWSPTNTLETRQGLRLEAHNAFGVHLLPSAGVQVRPTGAWTLSATAGTGFRAPTAFYEVFKGVRPEGYALLFTADRPERTLTAVLALDLQLTRTLLWTLTGEWARVRNPLVLVTDVDEGRADAVGEVRVESGEGDLTVLSLDTQLTFRPSDAFQMLVAGMAQAVDDTAGALITPVVRQRMVAQLTWQPAGTGLRVDLSADLRAPIPLDEVLGGPRFEVLGRDPAAWLAPEPEPGVAWDPSARSPASSPWVGILNLRAARTFGALTPHVGIDNVLDTVQARIDSPLFMLVEEGQSPVFDVVNVWGPVRGRFVYAGLTAAW